MLLHGSSRSKKRIGWSYKRGLFVTAGSVVVLLSILTLNSTHSAMADPAEPTPGGAVKPGQQDASRQQSRGMWTLSKDLAETDEQLVSLPDNTSTVTLGPGVTKTGFREIARMSNLRRLCIFSTDIDDEDLKILASHEKLRMIQLGSSTFTDGCFTYFKALPELWELWFYQARITDGGLSHLKELPGLRRLTIDRALITDAGMDVLKELRNLKMIRLSHVHISDAGLEKICHIDGVEALALTDTDITDEGLRHLSGLTSLRTLSLRQGGLTNKGLEYLGKVTSLKYMTIFNGDITSEGLVYLKDLHELRSLSLSILKSRVSEKAVAELQKALPNCKIYVGTPLTSPAI